MTLQSSYINVSGLYQSQGRYFILWYIVDPRTEPKPNPNPNPEPNPNTNPNPNPNPNPAPKRGFTISHKMKYLRVSV